jgi:hypothetical protein
MFYEQKMALNAASGAIVGNLKSYPMDATTPSPLTANSGIGEQLGVADHVSQQLGQELAALESRLASVLRPSMPSGANEGQQQARPTPSQLACGLRELNERLYGLLGRVQDINARVDL